MPPPIDLDRHARRPARDSGLQRALASPVLAAAIVAVCGLAADRALLRSGPPTALVVLFAAIVAGAAFAAGLFGGRRSLPLSLLVTLAAVVTSALMLRRLAVLRAADPRLPDLPTAAVAAALLAGGALGLAFAVAGARLRGVGTRRPRDTGDRSS